MEWPLVFWLWALVLVGSVFDGCNGCLEEERMALLELKGSINYPTGSSLPSWDEEESSDCCGWESVTCDHTIGRVTQLVLNNTREDKLGQWFPNASLFLSFNELQSLDLSGNSLSGWADKQGDLAAGFIMLSRLSKLEKLSLSGSKFNESIIPYLGVFKSLRRLEIADLAALSYTGSESFFRLNKLEFLDIGWNCLNESILQYVGGLPSLKALILEGNQLREWPPVKDLAALSNLEVLDLSENEMTGSVPDSVGLLTSLQAFSLGRNRLNGSLPYQGLCKLKNLEELILNFNEFDGELDPCLGNLTSLQVLALNVNNFSGSIPTFLITSLTSLEFLSLSANRFTGSFWFGLLANLSDLKVVSLQFSGWEAKGTYTNQLEVQTEFPPWVPTFQLDSLLLSNCQINNPTGVFPTFLSTQYHLKYLDLSHNNLKGRLPTWLLENPRLSILNLKNNSFTGPFDHLHSHPNYSDLILFDVSINHFSGNLPVNLGLLFPHLLNFNISRNDIHGKIPSSVGDMNRLVSLDLSSNKLSGEIPEHLAVGCISLVNLKLSNNMLQGQIFPKSSNMTSLRYLYLNGNQLTGELPIGLISSFDLRILDIGNNSLTGNLPSHIGNFSALKTLIMNDNDFQGPIPKEYCRFNYLNLLDMSENSISGSLPSYFNLSSLRYFHLARNKITGVIPDFLSKTPSLVTLDIRYNKLLGNIPNSIGALSGLRILLLKENQLEGHIPIQLCELTQIDIIDLSSNKFFGQIPPCFSNMTFGSSRVIDDAFVTHIYEYHHSTYPQRSRYGLQIIDRVRMFKFKAMDEKEEVEFTTKRRSYTYSGDILCFMSGMDLSSNQLTGEIPVEIAYLCKIHALNLSHNQLTGPIPKTLMELKQIESLDLSYNRLSGEIPPGLHELNFLSTFTVAHNNLSGRTLDMKGQFGTFGETSFEGNPLLCGPPLTRNCPVTALPPLPTSAISGGEEEDDGFNFVEFYASFIASYVVWCVGFMTCLYFSSSWRRAFFHYVFECFDSVHYVIVKTFRMYIQDESVFCTLYMMDLYI